VKEDWELYASTFMEMWQRLDSLKICGDFSVLGRVTRNRGRFTILDPSREPAVGRHLPDADDIESEVHQPLRDVLGGSVAGKMSQHCLNRLLRLREEGEVGEGILGKVIFNCQVVHHVLGDYPGPVPGVPELKGPLHKKKCFIVKKTTQN
jgi:hypothetical protein